MGGGKTKTPTVAPPEPKKLEETSAYLEEQQNPTDAKVRDEEANKLRKRKGSAGTILTNPLGTSGGLSNILGL